VGGWVGVLVVKEERVGVEGGWGEEEQAEEREGRVEMVEQGVREELQCRCRSQVRV
jgi:hypothetical protein